MRARNVVVIMLVPWLVTVVGCAHTTPARYVYQDGEFGVVGIPENTDRWPTHYRRHAETLMDAHFPEGHEIVRAEEVVEGSRVLTVQGAGTAELGPQLRGEVLSVGKLGRTTSRSQADHLKIKECRIIYRRASRPDSPDGFAALPSLTPTLYVDPNVVPTSGRDDPVPSKVNKSHPTPRDDEADEPAPPRANG